jgi:hypothetical protein
MADVSTSEDVEMPGSEPLPHRAHRANDAPESG